MTKQDWRDFADRINNVTPEQIAMALASVPMDVAVWGILFEASTAQPVTLDLAGFLRDCEGLMGELGREA